MTRALAVLAVAAVLGFARPAAANLDPNRPLDDELAQLDANLHRLATPGKPEIVLVTMGIGSLIWERHGHIALCVLYGDPRKRDYCYNYGVASFHQPVSMAWGFFRGTHSFWVAKSPPREMLWVYLAFDRTIWAQVLKLDDDQVKRVIAKLEDDIKEENKYYAYDHFADNCTTRARDIIDDVTGGSLRKMPEDDDGRTFRDLARAGFFGMRVPLLITDIAMGRSTDRVPTYWEKMFLPQYLREAVAKNETLGAVKPVVLYERQGDPPLDDGPSGRVIFGLILLVLTSPAWATRLWGRFQRAGLITALVPQLILGTVLLGLAIISPLPYVRWNESCLVLLPTDILLVAFLTPERRKKYARGRVYMLAGFVLLNLIGLFKQPIIELVLWPLVPNAVVGFWPAPPKPPEPEPEPKKAPPTRKKSKK